MVDCATATWHATEIEATAATIVTNLCALSKDVTAEEDGATIPATAITEAELTAVLVTRDRLTACPPTTEVMHLHVSMKEAEPRDDAAPPTAVVRTTVGILATTTVLPAHTRERAAATPPLDRTTTTQTVPVTPQDAEEVRPLPKVQVLLRKTTTQEATLVRAVPLIVPPHNRKVVRLLRPE